MGHVCPWWFAYTFDNPLRPLFHNPEKMFSPYVQEGMHVADIGCGLGYFSLGLARMVGDKGSVVSVDVQQQMLDRLRKRAAKAGLLSIIKPRLCEADKTGLNESLDFILAFWMVHEVPDPEAFFRQLYPVLKPSGILFVSEPRFHVSTRDFQHEVASAERVGFHVVEKPKIRWSHTVALKRQVLNNTGN